MLKEVKSSNTVFHTQPVASFTHTSLSLLYLYHHKNIRLHTSAFASAATEAEKLQLLSVITFLHLIVGSTLDGRTLGLW